MQDKMLYGEETRKALSNFQISNIHAPQEFQRALGTVKLAAARSNHSLGLIEDEDFKRLEKACQEFIDGKYDSHFHLDVFQAGAGTSYNMNANEVIGNVANLHPNNDVNMAQSTNDTIPTATRIATLQALPALLSELTKLEEQLELLAKKHENDLKVGRTHLQDAVPITFGQEFDSFKEALKKSHKFIEQQAETLKVLGIGGTAVGTGINTDPEYKSLMVQNLSEITKINFTSAKNLTEIANNMNEFLNLSAALRSLTTNLLNLSNNLKLLNMGPKAGLGEITLPEVQAGSSIMPGKINPSICECLEMICFQAHGNDETIKLAAQGSQFELNVYCPIIMFNLLQSIKILTNGMKMLREKALEGLKVNTEHAKNLLNNSLAQATALAPYIGYKTTAKIVQTALEKNIPLKKAVLDSKLLNEEQIEKILSPQYTTKPSKLIPGFQQTD